MKRQHWILAALCAFGCAPVPQTIPVIEAGDPPPPSSPRPAPPQYVAGESNAPPPRVGVAVFSAAAVNGEATYSEEWTTAAVKRLEELHALATAHPQQAPLPADLDKGTQDLASKPEAKAAEILIAGTVIAGQPAQVHLLVRETREGRLLGRSEFEGEIHAALERAVDDALAQATHPKN